MEEIIKGWRSTWLLNKSSVSTVTYVQSVCQYVHYLKTNLTQHRLHLTLTKSSPSFSAKSVAWIKKIQWQKKKNNVSAQNSGSEGQENTLWVPSLPQFRAARQHLSFFLLNFVIILLLRRTPNLIWSIISLNIITSWNNSEMKKFRLHSGCFQVVLWIWSSLIMRSAWSTSNSGSLFFLFKILHSRSLRSFIINL